MSTKMKAAQISKAGGDWELVERDFPNRVPPGTREGRGMWHFHSDALVKEGLWRGFNIACAGHEIAGRVDAMGTRHLVAVGQRVASAGTVATARVRAMSAW